MWSNMYIGLYVKCPLSSSVFSETKFLDRFLKNTQILNSMKINSVGVELFHVERQELRRDYADSSFS